MTLYVGFPEKHSDIVQNATIFKVNFQNGKQLETEVFHISGFVIYLYIPLINIILWNSYLCMFG